MKLIFEFQSFAEGWRLISAQFTKAVTGAGQKASSEIETAAKQVVASSGKFGGKFTEGLRAVTIEGNGFNSEIQLVSDIPFFSVFDKGVTIHGNPFLWLPLSFGDAAGQRATAFSGQLFMVNRRTGGPPLLLSIQTKKPMFVGITSVTIPKKWDMKTTVERVMSGFA